MLDDDGRSKVARTREDAVVELHAALENTFASSLLGLPVPSEARRLFDGLGRALHGFERVA